MIIDRSNIHLESSANLTAIAKTGRGFANPVDSVKMGFAFEVEKDDLGNIRTVIRAITPADYAFIQNTGVI